MGTWTLDILTGDAEASPRVREIFGLDPTITLTYLSEYQSRVHPEDLPHMNELLLAIRNGERSDGQIHGEPGK